LHQPYHEAAAREFGRPESTGAPPGAHGSRSYDWIRHVRMENIRDTGVPMRCRNVMLAVGEAVLPFTHRPGHGTSPAQAQWAPMTKSAHRLWLGALVTLCLPAAAAQARQNATGGLAGPLTAELASDAAPPATVFIGGEAVVTITAGAGTFTPNFRA